MPSIIPVYVAVLDEHNEAWWAIDPVYTGDSFKIVFTSKSPAVLVYIDSVLPVKEYVAKAHDELDRLQIPWEVDAEPPTRLISIGEAYVRCAFKLVGPLKGAVVKDLESREMVKRPSGSCIIKYGGF